MPSRYELYHARTQADCTYANVLADTLGLSPLTTDAQISSHLKVVLRENDSPYGLLVQTGAVRVF
jgi:hypothetical protein